MHTSLSNDHWSRRILTFHGTRPLSVTVNTFQVTYRWCLLQMYTSFTSWWSSHSPCQGTWPMTGATGWVPLWPSDVCFLMSQPGGRGYEWSCVWLADWDWDSRRDEPTRHWVAQTVDRNIRTSEDLQAGNNFSKVHWVRDNNLKQQFTVLSV